MNDNTTTAPAAPIPATELRHPRSAQLDEMATLDILSLMNSEDAAAVASVGDVLPALASVVDAAAAAIIAGGRVHYFGAGTSGRLGYLDAVELLPTFNIDDDVIVPHMAGGDGAFARAVEGAEDSIELGASDAGDVHAGDVVIGITASGTTPYVAGALTAGLEAKAVTALFTSNIESPLARLATHVVAFDTGSEVLTGSTRLKSGTAQKIALNGFSTALMVRLERTWSNLMVSLVATNAKLRDRTVRILSEATGIGPEESRTLLAACGGDLKMAIVAELTSNAPSAAREALEKSNGSVRAALVMLGAR